MGLSHVDTIKDSERVAMNDGIRPFMLSKRDFERVADYYGVTVRTVQRWFTSDGAQRRQMIPASPPARNPSKATIKRPKLDENGKPIEGEYVYYRVRYITMFDPGDPGNGSADERKNEQGQGAGILQNMRLKCLLGAALGLPGGLYRPEEVFHGDTKTLVETRNYLDEAVHFLNTIYNGNAKHGYYIRKAWINMLIDPRAGGGWLCIVNYNEVDPASESVYDEEKLPDEEEVEPNEDSDEQETDD